MLTLLGLCWFWFWFVEIRGGKLRGGGQRGQEPRGSGRRTFDVVFKIAASSIFETQCIFTFFGVCILFTWKLSFLRLIISALSGHLWVSWWWRSSQADVWWRLEGQGGRRLWSDEMAKRGQVTGCWGVMKGFINHHLHQNVIDLTTSTLWSGTRVTGWLDWERARASTWARAQVEDSRSMQPLPSWSKTWRTERINTLLNFCKYPFATVHRGQIRRRVCGRPEGGLRQIHFFQRGFVRGLVEGRTQTWTRDLHLEGEEWKVGNTQMTFFCFLSFPSSFFSLPLNF